jgi:hypothetical protein
MTTLDRLHTTARTAIVALLAAGLAACGSETGPDGNGGDGDWNGGDQTTAWVVTGRVTDPQGRPLQGVEVVADNLLLYDSNVLGRTGADGSYRIDLPQAASTYRVTATYTKRWQGRDWVFPLEAQGEDEIAGNEGGDVDFEWKLTGERPGGGFHGGMVVVYNSYADLELEETNVELTLTPVGPLVDGSTGSEITAKPVVTADGDAIRGVPIGQYAITARYVAPGETPEPLLVRRRNSGAAFSVTLAGSFEAPFGTSLGIYQIDVEVERP